MTQKELIRIKTNQPTNQPTARDCGLMVILVRNGISNQSPYPEQDCVHFPLPRERQESISSLPQI